VKFLQAIYHFLQMWFNKMLFSDFSILVPFSEKRVKFWLHKERIVMAP